MSKQYTNIARTARVWSHRDSLTDAERSFCLVVAELAEALVETANAMPDERESLHLLGCRLCRGVGESMCYPVQPHSPNRQAGVCPLGFNGMPAPQRPTVAAVPA